MKHFSFNQSFIKSILVVVLTVCSLQMWGAEQTITLNFYNESKISSTSGTDVSLTYVRSSASLSDNTLDVEDVITGATKSGTVQYNKNGGVTFGANSTAAASWDITFDNSFEFYKVEIIGANYETNNFTINGDAADAGALNPKGTLLEDCTDTLRWELGTGDEYSGTLTFAKTATKRGTIYIITLYYDDGESATCTGSKVAVTKGATSNGNFNLSETEVCPDVPGGTINVTNIVPESGYQFSTITATNGTVDNTNKRVTNITAATTISVVFEAIPTYAIRFFNNGTQVGSTQNLPAGATAVKPSDPAACDEGYAFVGWWTAELDEDNTTAETWVTDFTVSGAQDYYAVFSHSDGSGSKYSKTPSGSSDLVSSAGGTVYTITIATGVTVTISGWTSNPPIYHSDGQWRIYGGSSVVIASSGDNISKIEFTSTQNYLSTTEGTYSAQTWTGDASSVTFTNGATQSRITGISVTIGEAGTTYYTTDCGSTCYTPTLTLSNGGATENKFVGDPTFTVTATPSNNPLGGTVSYTSNKPTKASVDPSTGEVTILDAMSNEPIIITATLDKVTSGTECQKKVTASYTLNIYNRVTWSVNGAPYTAGNPTQQTVEGGTITDYPTPNPDGSSVCGGKTFAGWTDAPISVPQATAPATLYTSLGSMSSVHINENKTFYAVFVDQSGDPDVYRKGTLSDLTHGQTTVIVNPAASKAMSNTGSAGSLNATAVSFNGSGKIENPAASLRWHVEKNAAQYKFKNGYYVYAYSTSSIYCDEDDATYTDYWTITASGSNYVMYSNRSSSSKYLECYDSKFQLYNAGTSGYFLMDFYVPDVSYADYTTTCGPTIKANEVEHLTSYKDQTVRSDSIVVRGSSLTADGTLTPSITGTYAGLFECTLASNAISAAGAIESKFVIRYTPTAFGDAQHTATLTFSDGTTTSDPITLNGRSLPEEFAIVAYDGAQYYVLDGTMTGSAALVKALPVTIEAGAVKLCPTQAVYSLTERATPDQYVHLVGPTGRRLYGEGSKTGLNTHTAGSTDGTGWLLATSDFNTYHITNATTTNRGIMLSNGTKTVFGHYKTSNYGTSGYYGDIQLLPITAKCTCLPEPAVTCVAKATKATLSWEAVEGATEYEITCSGGTVTSPVTGLTATITGLTESTNYTYSVKAVATGTDCSLYHNGAFKTTDCDDVPYDIFTTPGVHSVTIKWKMDIASTATIRIYSDEECSSKVGSDHEGLTSPATIEGLNENTTYYFKIWAGGTCVSAVETFTTNSTSVEIVEWFTDSIRIIIDAGADASVIIEDKKEHGSETGNVADKLFISKYFEADGNNKMVAIYNGTVDTIDITDMWFKHSNKGSSETKFCLKNFGKKPGKIAPNEEIIIMRYSSDTDPAKTCAEKEDNYDEWNIIHDGDTDGKGNDIYAWLCFSGPQSIGLYDGSTNKFIDVIGATTNNSGTGSLVQILASNSTHCSYTEKSANDGSGFYADGKEVETGNDILLSTNRCLLIRKNTVKSGDDAVANNVYTPQEDCSAEIGESFTTLGSEWMGYVIGKGAGAATKTCEGLAYVGGFDYQGYYTTYDSISGLKDLTGNQNPDGTYTIPIDSLDTLACTMMRIKVYEGGVEKASREYKIPIMVEGNKTTKDTIFINDNPNQLRTYNTCKECDVLILKGATLTKASHSELKDQDTINNLTIYPGGKFIVPEGDNYKYAVNSIHFRVQGEETPIVKLKGKVTTHDGQITVSRRITNDRYYFFSLPYDCDISDIRWSNGEVPTRGADYEIIEYDAATRAAQGSTKGAPGHWKPAGSTLHAGVGYCVAVSSAYIKELMFPMSIGGTDEDLTNKEDTKTTNKVTLEQHTGSSSINNHNWNLIAHPYVSPFDAYEDGKITAGWLNCVSPETETEDAVWEYVDDTHVYLTMPSFGASKTTYTQTVSSSITTLNPFLAVFVQAVSAGDLTFDKNHRQLNAAPARHLAAKAENEDESIFVGVTLSGNGQSDQTNVRIRPDFTDEYQLGYDLQKFTTFYTSRPQIYMKPADLQLAFQAVNDDKAKNTWMPMGVYCYEPGTFTFALSEDYPIDEVEAVYLYDKTTGTTTNLLYDTYTITTSKQLYSNTRFALNVIVNRRAPQITTDINAAGAPENMVRKILINGHVFIQRGKDIYDVTGKQVENF